MLGCRKRLVVDKRGKLDVNTDEIVEKVGDKNVSETEFARQTLNI